LKDAEEARVTELEQLKEHVARFVVLFDNIRDGASSLGPRDTVLAAAAAARVAGSSSLQQRSPLPHASASHRSDTQLPPASAVVTHPLSEEEDIIEIE
jgi:hypothetical protein